MCFPAQRDTGKGADSNNNDPRGTECRYGCGTEGLSSLVPISGFNLCAFAVGLWRVTTVVILDHAVICGFGAVLTVVLTFMIQRVWAFRVSAQAMFAKA
jgi:hypothetical protein